MLDKHLIQCLLWGLGDKKKMLNSSVKRRWKRHLTYAEASGWRQTFAGTICWSTFT